MLLRSEGGIPRDLIRWWGLEAYATRNRLTKNEGERKFSMNQNFTVLLVLRKTLKIMIDAKR